MRVHLLFLDKGARMARGLAVVIDVFRAFSTEPFVFAAGARRIIPVAELAEAYALKEAHPDWLLMGERGGVKQKGFDFGNSPSEFDGIDLAGKTLIHTTSAGTRGLVFALSESQATEVVTGSFVNIGAVLEHIRLVNPEEVSLVCMGEGGRHRSPEDDLCAMYMKNVIEGFPNDFGAIARHLRTVEPARKFFDPEIDWATERDFEMIMDMDAWDKVIRAERTDDGLIELTPIEPRETGGA